MSPVTLQLRLLRYYRPFAAKLEASPILCEYQGHEELLAWLNLYVLDQGLSEESYHWDFESLEQLEHIVRCPSCLDMVFAYTSAPMQKQVDMILQAVQ